METKEIFRRIATYGEPEDELALELEETNELFVDGFLHRELLYVIRHDECLRRPPDLQSMLSAVQKHLTRNSLRKHGEPIGPDLLHYVGQFMDGFMAGKFYMKNGEVHARCVWEAEGNKVDETFTAVVPNGEGDWLPCDISTMYKRCQDAIDDDPDHEYDCD